MPLETVWRLIFRTNNANAAERCLARALAHIAGEVIDGPKPYWKIPGLWEVTVPSPFVLPAAEGVFGLLVIADRLASGWLVSGPLMAGEKLAMLKECSTQARPAARTSPGWNGRRSVQGGFPVRRESRPML